MKLNTTFAFKIYLVITALLFRRAGANCQAGGDQQQGCRVAVPRRDTSDCPALILNPEAPRFLYPDDFGLIQVHSGEAKVRVQCPYPDFLVSAHTSSIDRNSPSALITCDGGLLRLLDSSNGQRSNCGQHQSSGTLRSLQEVGCSRPPTPVARLKDRYGTACPGELCVEVGFELSSRDFLAVIDFVAVDTQRLRPLVAYAYIPASINSRQYGKTTFALRSGPVFRNTNAQSVFHRDYQTKRLCDILGNNQYINGQTLVPSQLVSDNDIYYRVARGSAFFLENMVPVWEDVARGNWEAAGEIVRHLASSTTSGLHLWSGVIDTLALTDDNGRLRKIYLAEHELIPVPKLLFKYVYDPASQTGLVLVTVNEPRLLRGLTPDMVVCPELPDCQSTYPQLARRELGYTYCCSPRGFGRVAGALGLPTFPDARCFQL